MLIKHKGRHVSFTSIRLRRPFDAAGWVSRFGVEEHAQPGDGALVVFTFSAHIAYPGWEVRNGDQFLTKPGEISNVPEVHIAGGAFIAGN